MGGKFSLLATFESEVYMDSMKIDDYKDELIALCTNCNSVYRCKDHQKLCMRKKLAFAISKRVYKQRVKKGEIK